MRRVLALFAAGGLAMGVAQGITIPMLNTFSPGQTPPVGGPGPAAPLAATTFGGTTTVHALGVRPPPQSTVTASAQRPMGLIRPSPTLCSTDRPTER